MQKNAKFLQNNLPFLLENITFAYPFIFSVMGWYF